MMSTILDPVAIALLLLAGLMHATWNAILKAEPTDRATIFGVMMLAGLALGCSMVPFLPAVDPAAWKWMAASTAIHLFYYFFLLRAYAHGDLSHTYPIARGLGPLLVAMLSGRLLGESLRTQDIAGVALLSAGIVALALPSESSAKHRSATVYAILTGFTIAGYITVDGLGVRAAGPSLAHKLSYISWLNILEGPWVFLYALVRSRETVGRYLRQRWGRALAGGAIAAGGYGIAIWAMSEGPMAHVAALRETSVLFGALMGAFILGEPFGRRRILAAAVIVGGLVFMNGPTL
jgi:drug/metabolite transporter (DMT)-like permease